MAKLYKISCNFRCFGDSILISWIQLKQNVVILGKEITFAGNNLLCMFSVQIMGSYFQSFSFETSLTCNPIRSGGGYLPVIGMCLLIYPLSLSVSIYTSYLIKWIQIPIYSILHNPQKSRPTDCKVVFRSVPYNRLMSLSVICKQNYDHNSRNVELRRK